MTYYKVMTKGLMALGTYDTEEEAVQAAQDCADNHNMELEVMKIETVREIRPTPLYKPLWEEEQ